MKWKFDSLRIWSIWANAMCNQVSVRLQGLYGNSLIWFLWFGLELWVWILFGPASDQINYQTKRVFHFSNPDSSSCFLFMFSFTNACCMRTLARNLWADELQKSYKACKLPNRGLGFASKMQDRLCFMITRTMHEKF